MTHLQAFVLPSSVTGTASDIELGRELMRAWQADGIFQVASDLVQRDRTRDAIQAGRRFFRMPSERKARHVSDLTYSGYIASGSPPAGFMTRASCPSSRRCGA
ncbi:2-oxoglutarate and iron-dependent oxygenase domain-containing protein [Streptomyces sp. NPDC058686]|uniref:2-oxoglutarate and iron-dependent oxygenase domain-containing protein n=1 Tax=Streptomyces sp. NPDC058686 TaxID=3346599 RepID=UPI00365D8F6D